MTLRQRTSNALHRLAHAVDRAEQPLCACAARFFIEGIRLRRLAGLPAARTPEELRAYIAQRESGVGE